MSDRRLRYSERKVVAETGSLGELHDDPSADLRNAIWLYTNHVRGSARGEVRGAFDVALADSLGRHFGNAKLEDALVRPDVPAFLDALEIIAEEGIARREYRYYASGGYRSGFAACAATAEVDMNAMFDRHRFAYWMQDGLIRPISSPLLDAEIVGPALLTIERPGWEQVQRSYREALVHQRHTDELDDALTAAAASVEAAMKASGYHGATLGDLAKDFRRSPIATGYSPRIVEDLVDLLEQLMAWRSHSGDAHGKAPGFDKPPRELVALAVHWAGAFIAYLGALPERQAT